MLELSKTYKTKNGDEVKITNINQWEWGKEYKGNNLMSYTEKGEAYFVRMFVGRIMVPTKDLIIDGHSN
jgi:hypothetical protein